MKSTLLDKTMKVFRKYTSNGDNTSQTDVSDECDSLCEEKINFKIDKKQKFIQSNKNIEISNIKHLPTIFFIIFILLIGVLLMNIIPQIYLMSISSSLYKEKMNIKYVPEYLGDQPSAVKALIVISQFLLMLIIICLTSLIKQRISVPELKEERWRNYLIIITSCISVFSMISMTYYNKETLKLSRSFGFVDNLMYPVYVLSSFLYCLMTYSLLSKLHDKEMHKTKDSCYIKIKMYLIILMGIQVFCYICSTILVSFYNPIISQEKSLLSLLIINFSINSLLFLSCLVFFIFSLKYDLYYVYMNLQIRPDIEYFIDMDIEENQLSTTKKI